VQLEGWLLLRFDSMAREPGRAGEVTDELYWRGANDTIMKCITPEEGQIILQDVHAEVCMSHTGAKSLVGKTYRQGFFWLTAVSDADSIVHRCEGCQFFACQKHMPSHQL
jgi:hypothetical protein